MKSTTHQHETVRENQTALLAHSTMTYSSPCCTVFSHQLVYIQCYGQQTTPLPLPAIIFPVLTLVTNYTAC